MVYDNFFLLKTKLILNATNEQCNVQNENIHFKIY